MGNCVILFVLWALGMLTSYTLGGLVLVLLVLALVVIVINLVQGRRSLSSGETHEKANG